jgi:SepF-like predicted cell division protein (DUF552 family)
MGFLSNISKSLGSGSSDSGVDVDAFMSAAEAENPATIQQNADAYVKPIALQTDADLKVVEEELGHKNIVLLSITPYARNPTRLKEAVIQLKGMVSKINGDIARIEDDKILLTPANVKIVKSKAR